ncbi:tol-pal system protein YbgF [Halomonas sp. WWR20]
MKHSLKGLCGAGALVLPLSVWAQPVVEDLTAQPQSIYNQAVVREKGGGSLTLFNDVQENQQQIQQLRGEIEELRHQLEQLRQLSQERYLDLEQRLGQAPSRGSNPSDGQTSEAGTTENASAVSDDGGNAEGREAYQAAFQKVQSRDFDTAIRDFEAFIDNHPQSSLRANAHYWLGELYSAQSNLEASAQAFETVINEFPQSSKVPDALYKLGLLRARQGQPEDSRQLLERVQSEYPDSNAAQMASDFINQSGN